MSDEAGLVPEIEALAEKLGQARASISRLSAMSLMCISLPAKSCCESFLLTMSTSPKLPVPRTPCTSTWASTASTRTT